MNSLLIIALLVAALILLYQLYPLLGSFRVRGREVPPLSGVVPESLVSKPRYVLYFWAPQCSMCRSMTPIIERLGQQRDDLVKIDASQFPEAARALGVLGTPALVLVKKNVIEKVSLGARSEKSILKLLDA